MLLISVILTLISVVQLCHSLGHDYISPENYDEFHKYVSQVKKREMIDAILSEVGPHAAMPHRFNEVSYSKSKVKGCF